jgi:hypothetical protein
MEFEEVSESARWVVGLATRTNNSDEANPSRARLGALWRRAAPAGDAIAVLTDYESDRDGEYTQVVGQTVESAKTTPPGKLLVQVPAGVYATLPDSRRVSHSPHRRLAPSVGGRRRRITEEDIHHRLRGVASWRRTRDLYLSPRSVTRDDPQERRINLTPKLGVFRSL